MNDSLGACIDFLSSTTFASGTRVVVAFLSDQRVLHFLGEIVARVDPASIDEEDVSRIALALADCEKVTTEEISFYYTDFVFLVRFPDETKPIVLVPFCS